MAPKIASVTFTVVYEDERDLNRKVKTLRRAIYYAMRRNLPCFVRDNEGELSHAEEFIP